MKRVTLKIKGTQIDVNGEKNEIELITEGKFYIKNGSYYLVYNETELSGMEGSTTTLKIENEKVSMKRFGSNSSALIFEEGIKHKSLYQTFYGDMSMEVVTKKIDVNISEMGKGKVDLFYRLNMSNMIESQNRLSIEIM